MNGFMYTKLMMFTKSKNPLECDEDEVIELIKMDIDTAYHKVVNGEIFDSKTMIAILHAYINKTNHHIYIAPTEELKDIIAHYTITFPSEVPASSKLFHIIPDASGCFIFQGRSRRDFWGPMSEIVVLENDLQKAPARFFVEFRPGGLYQISGLHQKKLVNQRQQLRYLDVQLDEELALLYQSCKDYEQLIKAFNKYFTGKRKLIYYQLV